jgi:hypothetical protein
MDERDFEEAARRGFGWLGEAGFVEREAYHGAGRFSIQMSAEAGELWIAGDLGARNVDVLAAPPRDSIHQSLHLEVLMRAKGLEPVATRWAYGDAEGPQRTLVRMSNALREMGVGDLAETYDAAKEQAAGRAPTFERGLAVVDERLARERGYRLGAKPRKKA